MIRDLGSGAAGIVSRSFLIVLPGGDARESSSQPRNRLVE
jgi:hypothetical protein